LQVEAFRQLFPTTDRVAYLDHAAVGPLSRPVVETERGFLEGALGIVSFRSARHDSGDLHLRLRAEEVIVSLREGLVRVSPHFYNSEDEIDRLLAALP
jgi:selenocysteine lyase/cysteine desulfurase